MNIMFAPGIQDYHPQNRKHLQPFNEEEDHEDNIAEDVRSSLQQVQFLHNYDPMYYEEEEDDADEVVDRLMDDIDEKNIAHNYLRNSLPNNHASLDD